MNRLLLLGLLLLSGQGLFAQSETLLVSPGLLRKLRVVNYADAMVSTQRDTIVRLNLDNDSLRYLPAWLYECTALEELQCSHIIRNYPDCLNLLPRLSKIVITRPNEGFQISQAAFEKISNKYNTYKPSVYDSIIKIGASHDAQTPASEFNFGRLKYVRQLVLSGNYLNELPKSIYKLKALDSLYITKNRFNSFPYKVRRLRKLNLLDLSYNQIGKLEKRDFRKLKNLQHLNMVFNKVQHVPSSIGKANNLRSLLLSHNQIEYLPDEIGKLSNLRSLALYKNKLKIINENVYKLSKLEELDLYYNELEMLSESLGHLRNLTHLYLSYNSLKSIPASVGDLQHLRELYIHHNQLSFAPQNLMKLSNLEVFHAQQNRIAVFPSELLQLKKLKEIDLSGNLLSELPRQIAELPHLKMLFIKGNDFPPELLESLLFRQLLEAAEQGKLNLNY